MKRLILALISAGTLATSANAQEPKSVLLYGDLNLQTVRNTDLSKNTNWDANIGLGYQFNRNWTLGGNIMWGQDATKSAASIRNTDNMYRLGAFGRWSHYIGRSETFFYYCQFDFAYQGGYHTNEGNPATAKHSGIYAGFTPALGINFGKALCLNVNIGGLGYTTDKFTDVANATNTFAFNFGHSFGLGLSKNFNTGHKMHSHHEPGDEVHHRKMDADDDDAAPKAKKKERSRDDDE